MEKQTPNSSEDSNPRHELPPTTIAHELPSTDMAFKPASVSHGRFWLLSIGLCLGLFLAIIDSSIVATSLYTISIDFKATDSINWVALAYTLSNLSCTVTMARVSDIIGRRSAFLLGYTLFVAFSLGCTLAQNLTQLILFRTLQGLGGSGMYSLVMVILPELCPEPLLKYLGSIVGIVITGSGVLGPVLGGVLTHYASWRWVFGINIPIGVISMAIFFFAWPKEENLPSYERRKWKEFDFVGSVLIIGAVVLLVFPFQHYGDTRGYTWNTPSFIVPLVFGITLWIVLGGWEWFIEKRMGDRIATAFPINIFRNRAFTAGALSTMLIGFPFLLLVFSFPLRAQVVRGQSAVMSGIMLLPMLGSSAIGTIVAGRFSSIKKNYIPETLCLGACLMTIGCGLLTTISPDSDAKALGFLVFSGLGFGLSTSAATMMTSLEVPICDYAPAQGIIGQLRILGGSLGIATSTIFTKHQTMEHLIGLLTPQQLGMLGRGGPPLTAVQKKAVETAYSNAFRDGMIVCTAIAGAAVLVSLTAYRRVRPIPSEQKEALRQQETARRIAKSQRAAESVSTLSA